MSTCPTCQEAYPPETVVCPMDGTALGGDPALESTQPDPILAKPKSGPDPLLGTTLAGRFNITRRIGEGGMGMVYEASHAVIGRSVAIKVLHERHADRPEVAARLMNEAKLASSIHHDHIVDIFDFGETADGRTFVVMELLDGESLTQLIRRDGPLGEERTIDIGLQIASALGAAHEKGIIHRDVKPENVFLSHRDGKDFAKVLDFGISKALRVAPDGTLTAAAGPRLTQTGMVLGTPLYMSPEQARGEDDLDHRIDVYALGVILYECLTGEVPFRGSNYLGIISQVLTDEPVPPRRRAPDRRISEGIERVVMKALSKPREERYQSMVEIAADLQRVLDGQPVNAPATAVVASATVAPPKSRPAVWVAVAVATLVAGGVALFAALRASTAAQPGNVGAVLSPAPSLPPPPAPPLPSPSVIIRVTSTPPGAQILDGSRKLGVAPQPIELPRSDQPVHLTFRLEGYDDGLVDVIPKIDGDKIDIELLPSKKSAKGHSHARSPSTSAPLPSDPLPGAHPYGATAPGTRRSPGDHRTPKK